MSNTVEFNSKGLQGLAVQLGKLAGMQVKVGILSSKAARKPGHDDEAPINNPTLGAVHEFGSLSKNIPARSFIRMPLGIRFKRDMNELGADYWLNELAENGARHTAALVGVAAEDTIQEAFATGGWGAWPKLQPETVAKKGSSAILIDSAQMRKSISSAVQTKGAD